MSKELAVISPGAVLAQYGPMRLTIQAWTEDGPSTDLAAKAGEFSFSLLPRLIPARDLFRREKFPFETSADEPMLKTMIQAIKHIGLKELGPMAAVAGTVAETVNLYLKDLGAVKSIVENGGDLSIYLTPEQSANVGVRLGVDDPAPSYRLKLSGIVRPLWGVASSGLGGRSLTMGIADTALCLAASAPVADAAATAVANYCLVETPAVKRVLAENIDPETDIRGLWVTESVGGLSDQEIESALTRAVQYAQYLTDKNILLGAVISLRGRVVMTRDFDQMAAPFEPMES